MITKSFAKNGKTCRVTFKLPKGSGADTAALCGSFNDWDPQAHPMKRLKDGSFSVAVSLKTGHKHEFRYLLDHQRWENDAEADSTAPTEFGSLNSVIET